MNAPDDTDARVRLAQLHLYVNNHLHDKYLAPLLTLVTAALLTLWVPWWQATAWAALELAIIAVYIRTYHAFKRASPGPEGESGWTLRIALAHGAHMISWSSIVLWGWQQHNPESLMFVMLIHVGLISLTVTMSNPHRRLLQSDLMPPALALLGPPLISAGAFSFGLSLLGLFFLVLMLQVGMKVHASNAEALRLRERNAELILELERQATHDALTGVPNRRQILHQATLLIQRALAARRPLAVMILDIDRFKPINDRWGHLSGDEVLRAVADACRAGLRPQDCMGRLGGEEFGILLADTDRREAMAIAERLREQVAALAVTLPGGSVLHPTVSIGVTQLEAADALQTAALPTVLHRADLAMYRAKTEGRDRVAFCDQAQATQLDREANATAG